jgi:hypothetical protein
LGVKHDMIFALPFAVARLSYLSIVKRSFACLEMGQRPQTKV